MSNKKQKTNILDIHPEYKGQELSKHDIKEIEKVDHLEHYYEKPLHFHLSLFIIGIIVFLVAAALAAIGIYILALGGLGHKGEFHIETTGVEGLVLDLIIVFGFAIVVQKINHALRILFRIGRRERVRRAEAKNKAKLEKYKEKHMPKIK